MANLLKWVQGVGRQEALRTMGGNVGSDGRRRRVHAAGQDEGTAGIRADASKPAASMRRAHRQANRPPRICYNYELPFLPFMGGESRTGGRVVEGARLESVYTSKAYRGFESPSVRQF